MPVTKTRKTTAKKAPKAGKKTVSAKEEKNCSFCGKPAENARMLIAGPNDIFICDECIEVCVKMLGEENGSVICPMFSIKTSRLLAALGSQLHIQKNQRTRVKYDVLYLAPNNPLSEKLYTSHVVPIAAKHKINVKHLSEVLNSKLPFDKEILDIYNASLVIADIHGQDPDIMYFLGMISLIGKPVILLLQKTEDIPNGLFSERCIYYKNTEKSLSEISTQIQPLFLALKKIKKLVKSSRRKSK